MTDKRPPSQAPEDEQINLWKLAAVMVRRWRTIMGAILLGCLVALGISILRPESYVARTVIVPSAERGNATNLLAATQLPPALAGMLAGTSSNQRLIGGVLKSRSLADSMVTRLGMTRDVNPRGEATVRQILAEHTKIENHPDGSVVIQVRDTDPVRATRIANEFPELVNVIMAGLSSHVALRKQKFFEDQLAHAQERLVQSEERLIQFQLAQDAPEIQEQARRSMEAAALLQQQIMEQEITVSQLRRTATPDNPELRSAIAQLNATRGQLARLTTGQGRANQVFLSMRESPELKVDATRLLREYNKDEQMYISLTAALSETQIDANNNLPVVSVLDPAIIPEYPAGVNLGLVLGMAVLLGLVTGLAAAYIQEFVLLARRDPASEQFFAAWDQLKADVAGYLPLRGRRQARLPMRG